MVKTTLLAAVGSIFGAITVLYLFHLKQNKPKKRKKKDNLKIEFKKKIVFLVLVTYFIGVIVGTIITFIDPSQLSALLTYIGAPTTGAILSYCWVVRTENAIKLKQSYPQETEGIPIDLNNTNM